MATLSFSSPVAPRFLTSPSTSRPGKPFPSLITFSTHIRPRVAASSSSPKPFAASVSDSVPRLELSPIAASTFASAPQTAAGGADSDLSGFLLRDRIVFLGHDIDDFVADVIISQILLLDAQDPTKDIRLFINCSGGSYNATMAIFDVLQLVRADVSTVALGIVASSSSIILTGGTKGKRFAMPNARIMMHQPMGGFSGKAADVEIQAKELISNKQNLVRIISDCTGQSIERVEKDIDLDYFMSPIEAVEYGVIDGVIDKDSIIPLQPLPKKANSRFGAMELSGQLWQPEVPDDEIY